MRELTERQKQIATIIKDFTEEKGYAPSVREIATVAEITPKAAFDHLQALQRKGVIRVDSKRSRAIEIISTEYRPQPKELREIPVLGRIAAGTPLFSEENFDYYVSIPEAELSHPDAEYYALRVAGESMIEAGINDGDLAIIRKTDHAENGEIIVAGVGDDRPITLKRFFRRDGRIELRPENSEMEPIYTVNCEIFGKLAMIIRKYR